MNKFQPFGQDTDPAPPAIVEQPAVLEDPQAGGCYTRDPITGVLTLVTPSTDNT